MGSALNIYRNPPESHVKQLLAQAKLPASDLSARHLEHFFACGPAEALVGIVGLEIYGDIALLRSLAVSINSRGNGYGKALLGHAERYAQSRGVTQIYLLTTTASEFFGRLGYRKTTREAAPDVICQTQEFSALCPANSVVMLKVLPANSTLHPTR